MNFFVEKVREAFALQKLLIFFQQKILANLGYLHANFIERLTNDVVSFEQPGPGPKLYFGITKITDKCMIYFLTYDKANNRLYLKTLSPEFYKRKRGTYKSRGIY